MEEICIPKNVTVLYDHCFANCTALKSITIEEGLKEIGMNAFYGTAIESIIIPASIEKMDTDTFDHCDSLRSITFLGDAPTINGIIPLGTLNENLIIYYNTNTFGWDATKLKDWYTLVAK